MQRSLDDCVLDACVCSVAAMKFHMNLIRDTHFRSRKDKDKKTKTKKTKKTKTQKDKDKDEDKDKDKDKDKYNDNDNDKDKGNCRIPACTCSRETTVHLFCAVNSACTLV